MGWGPLWLIVGRDCSLRSPCGQHAFAWASGRTGQGASGPEQRVRAAPGLLDGIAGVVGPAHAWCEGQTGLWMRRLKTVRGRVRMSRSSRSGSETDPSKHQAGAFCSQERWRRTETSCSSRNSFGCVLPAWASGPPLRTMNAHPALASTSPAVPAHAGGLSSGGFFSHHGPWAPGVRLFRTLQFRAKAAIVSAFFLLPILALSIAMIQNSREQIGVAEAERTGVQTLRALQHHRPQELLP